MYRPWYCILFPKNLGICLTLVAQEEPMTTTLLPYLKIYKSSTIPVHPFCFHNVYITIANSREEATIELWKFITGIVHNSKAKSYEICANMGHMHFLVSRNPSLSEQYLAAIVSKSSEMFINENKLCDFNFRWQQSASAFSVSKSDVDRVCKYILNQTEHHKKITYAKEYDLFIKHYQDTLIKGIQK